MTASKYTIGIDFGTASARAVLASVETGEVVATAVHPYADGVIDEALPGGDQPLPPDWALQNPDDWLDAIRVTIPAVLAESGVAAADVIGLGIDFTGCTVLPTTADGTPLCTLDAYRQQPHAWPKLWKHHGAQPQVERVNALAGSRGEPWLARYGGKISSEWLIPKALQILEEAPAIYDAAVRLVEGSDWATWQLTGVLARNACAAGYKATWHKVEGFPSTDYLAALHPQLIGLYQSKLAGPILPPGHRVGGLTQAWADQLGLLAGTPVAAAILDAHSALLGGGVGTTGVMFMIMGTSTCHMVLGEREVPVGGIQGVVEDGIIPGWFAYEAGQAGVGDIFAWFVENAVPPLYHEEAARQNKSLHTLLSEKAALLAPGGNGLLVLDWWNGCRSTLVDAGLSGLLVGCTLATEPEEIYRALIESTAFGTRVIIEAFTVQGVPVEAIVAGGGLTKNSFLMQCYADITGRELAVAGSEQVSALGAAMLGAVAAGPEAGGYAALSEAVSKMSSPPATVYRPITGRQPAYDALYAEYLRLYDYFGRGENEVMKVLRRLRQAASQ
jgi:L-ribulokinase